MNKVKQVENVLMRVEKDKIIVAPRNILELCGNPTDYLSSGVFHNGIQARFCCKGRKEDFEYLGNEANFCKRIPSDS